MDGGVHKITGRSKSDEVETAYGWSPDYLRGYIDGVACRTCGRRPSNYQAVGIDEYALGFRTGFYNR